MKPLKKSSKDQQSRYLSRMPKLKAESQNKIKYKIIQSMEFKIK